MFGLTYLPFLWHLEHVTYWVGLCVWSPGPFKSPTMCNTAEDNAEAYTGQVRVVPGLYICYQSGVEYSLSSRYCDIVSAKEVIQAGYRTDHQRWQPTILSAIGGLESLWRRTALGCLLPPSLLPAMVSPNLQLMWLHVGLCHLAVACFLW